MKYSLYGSIGLVLIFIVSNFLNYDVFSFVVGFIEWATRFVLPWIALFWFIQFVKSKKG